MFIFTMLFNLIMLPFTLIGMVFGLLGISTRVLLLPLKIVAKNPLITAILAVSIILFLAIKKEPHSLDTLKPAPAPQNTAPRTANGQPPIIEAVKKIEDGDSAFATDLYSTMTDQEKSYYSAIFYKVMSTTPNGTAQSWKFYNIHGSIRPVSTFRNKSGVVCRKFTEVLKVHRIQQTLSGTACDNGERTWCKLRPNATPACNLGGKMPGMFDGLTNAVQGLF